MIACSYTPCFVGSPAKLCFYGPGDVWEATLAYDEYEIVLLHRFEYVQWNFRPSLKYAYRWRHWNREAVLNLWEDGSVSFQHMRRDGVLQPPCDRRGTWHKNSGQLTVYFNHMAWAGNAVHHVFDAMVGSSDCWMLTGCTSAQQWCVLSPLTTAEPLD